MELDTLIVNTKIVSYSELRMSSTPGIEFFTHHSSFFV